MELKYGRQIEITEIHGENIDLFLFGANHEQRALTCFKKLFKTNKISNCIGLCYNSADTKSYSGFLTKVVESHEDIFDILDSSLSELKKDRISILVDYSCMTKSWYYSIILFLSKKEMQFSEMNVFFNYTPAKFSVPQHPKPNSEIAPLPGKYVVPTDKPKALIVCLGYEKEKAEGIIDHLDPKVSYIFFTNPALDDRFVQTLKTNNENILTERSIDVVEFPFDDLNFLEKRLTALYLELKDRYSIIIAPLGPKPFTFIAMVMSVKYNDIDIWRVGSGSDINHYKQTPIPNRFIMSVLKFTGR